MDVSFQKTIIIGHVGKDPEVRYLDGSGTCVAKFSVATNESYKNREGEKVKHTEWFSCVAWRKTAEVIEKYIKKGSQVSLVLKKKDRKWIVETTQEERTVTEFQVLELTMLGRPPEEPKDDRPESNFSPPKENETGQAPQAGTQQQSSFDGNEGGPDDLPF